MSYILDALRKAESERAPGTLRNLHAQPVFNPSPANKTSVRKASRRSMIVTALLMLLVVLAWFKPWQTIPIPVATLPAPVQPKADAAQAAPQPAPVQLAPPIAPAAAVSRQTLPEKPARSKAALPQKLAETTLPQSAPVKQKVQPQNPPQVTVAAPDNAIATLRELPEKIQKEIPILSISGYLYSDNQAVRTVLLNKTLLHEGDQAAPGLTLEKMTPNGLIFNYKGYRYRAAY